MKKLPVRLIPDVRESWKYFSNIAASVTGLLAAAYQYLPAIQQYFPEGWVKWAALVIIIGRVVDQHPKKE